MREQKMSDIQLTITTGRNGKKTTITINQEASIEELLKKISQWNGIDANAQRVVFGGKQLESFKSGKKQYLSDYGVEDLSELFLVCLLPGGSYAFDVELKQLPDDIETSTARDMITWDDSPDNKRAKMPCGHAITPTSLTMYCRSLLTARKYTFPCPYIDRSMSPPKYCGVLWEYYLVRRVAVLNAQERKEFETKLSENYLRRAVGIQDCPKCSTFVMRENKRDRRVRCLICSKEGTNYEFCWYCLKPWKTSGITLCGNTSCSGEDPRLEILRKAAQEGESKKIVGLSNCPSTRACPSCGLLIFHTKDCKHMVCPCGQKFCFICLKKADTTGNYMCGSFNSHCTIAPVQTKIPGED